MPRVSADAAKIRENSQDALPGATLLSLRLTAFRNFRQAAFDFRSGLNVIYGDNGTGKTSILEAIHFLCLGKSFLAGNDRQAIAQEQGGLRIEGTFRPQTTVALVLTQDGRKQLYYNDLLQTRLADHVGRLPVVVASPADQQLADASGVERRRFLDTTLAQVSPKYLEDLLTYNRLLHQRNALLRITARGIDMNLLQTLDAQLERPAQTLFEQRAAFCSSVAGRLTEYFHYLSGGREQVTLRYHSALTDQPLSRLLEKCRDQDLRRQCTTAGIHRDELIFLLNNQPLRHFGSQGQKKSFTLALRLAQFDFIRQQKSLSPLLLVDDYADRLDAVRSQAFLELVQQHEYVQVFLTHTQLPGGFANPPGQVINLV